MTPKGRGRRAQAVAAAQPDPTPKKRGRPAKPMGEPTTKAVETPKKRGRPAKNPVQETTATAVESLKRRGRAPKESPPAPQKRAGRPRKEEAVSNEALSAPKPRGRRPKQSLDLNRVAGSPRIGTRTSPRTTRPRRAAVPAPVPLPAALYSSRRGPGTKKPSVGVARPSKRRGRLSKSAADLSAPNKTLDRRSQNARVTKAALKPRKRRGFTTVEIPDKYLDSVQSYLQQLISSDSSGATDDDDRIVTSEELPAQEQDPGSEELSGASAAVDGSIAVQDVEIVSFHEGTNEVEDGYLHSQEIVVMEEMTEVEEEGAVDPYSFQDEMADEDEEALFGPSMHNKGAEDSDSEDANIHEQEIREGLTDELEDAVPAGYQSQHTNAQSLGIDDDLDEPFDQSITVPIAHMAPITTMT